MTPTGDCPAAGMKTRAKTRRIVRMTEIEGGLAAIRAYEDAHLPGNTPAAVLASQRRHGVAELTIYRLGDRLVMVMDVTDAFDPRGLDQDAQSDPVLIDWHRRMSALQRPVEGEVNWAEMRCVFRQSDHA